LARHEGNFRPSAEEPLSLDDLLDLLSAEGHDDSRVRQEAIACFLSAGEGWREAVKKLGGAFAEAEAGLRERQSD
jgi:putative heme iron utilization protein